MAVTKKKVAFGTSAGIAAMVAVILGGVYHDEGGYVNHASDPGGETNLGVTKAVAREAGWQGTMKSFPKQCDTETDVCADRIYYENYMVKPGYVPIILADAAIGEELVNTAVNMNYPRPNKFLQASLNEVCPNLPGLKQLTVDGKLGPASITYFTTCQTKVTKVSFCKIMLDKLDEKQKLEYDRLVRNNRALKVFYRGWINKRIGNVDRKKCVA